jgi:hypothetical protein
LKNESKRKNIIGFEEREQIWIPNLVFDNSIKDIQIRNDDFVILKINQNGAGNLSFYKDNLKENLEFDGLSNSLIFSRSYKMSLICNFEQHNYPFDYQKCFIEVKNTHF